MKKFILPLIAALVVPALTYGQSAESKSPKPPQPGGAARTTADASAAMRTQVSLAKEIRHELLTLPFYDVFDWIDFQLSADGTTVTLSGQVVRPTTKSDAEKSIKKIEGIAQVDNQIEVLPLSPMDDQLRKNLYRAIYNSDSPLFRYGVQAVPPIHIIVNRGRATLKGVVANKSDSDLAYIAARGVSGVFGVTNELQIESASPAAVR